MSTPFEITVVDARDARVAVDAAREVGLIYVDDYGADPTGKTLSDTAVADAISALGTSNGQIVFGTGTYSITKTIALGAFQGVVGQGQGATTLQFSGTGDCIAIFDTTSGGTPPGDGWIKNLTIAGTGAGANANGIHVGDLYRARIVDVWVRDFTAAGCSGILFANKRFWCERTEAVGVTVDNCTRCVVFTGASGAVSYDYSTYDFSLICYADQDGIVIEDNAVLGHATISVRGNFVAAISAGGLQPGWTDATANTGVAFTIGTSSSDTAQIYLSEIRWLVEAIGNVSGENSAITHATINLGENAAVIANGMIDFVNDPGFTFRDGTNSEGQFTFAGRLNVDSVFGQMSGQQAATHTGAITFPGYGGFYENSIAYLATGNYFFITLASGANTISALNVPPGQIGIATYDFIINQPSSGTAGTVTWPSNISWPTGAAPTLSTTNNNFNVVRLYTQDHATFRGVLLA